MCGRAPRALPEGIAFAAADLRDAAARRALVAEVETRLGGLDVLVNNAATQTPMDVRAGLDLAAVEAEVALNLVAPMHLASLFLPLLRARPTAAIVNVTSALALVPKRSAPVYCATKAALRSFTQALRYQLAGTPVRVVEVLPPLVDTAMTAGRGRGKLPPDDVARALVRGLEGGCDEVRIGKTKWLFAAHRLSPALAGRLMRDA